MRQKSIEGPYVYVSWGPVFRAFHGSDNDPGDNQGSTKIGKDGYKLLIHNVG